jgi:hypothetical protein
MCHRESKTPFDGFSLVTQGNTKEGGDLSFWSVHYYDHLACPSPDMYY